MSKSEFQKEFQTEAAQLASETGMKMNMAFTKTLIDYLIDAEVCADFTASGLDITAAGVRVKADGYVFDEFDKSLTLFCGDYDKAGESTVLTKAAASEVFDCMYALLRNAGRKEIINAVEPNTPAADLLDTLNTEASETQKYRLVLLTNKETDLKNLSSYVIGPLTVERQVWSVDRIYEVINSANGREEINIQFADYGCPDGIPCIEATSAETKDFRSYLCVIPGKVLADIYDKYGAELMEGNVRSFLSSKVAVNKGIRSTILGTPENFFVYNNGIACTATGVVIDSTSKGLAITAVNDLQIINGGQTTASLSTARLKDHADLRPIYVQMKLTEISTTPEKALEMVHMISRTSNSQNKVTDDDFFSTHPFHVRMDDMSRACMAPATEKTRCGTYWFYERSRGQYNQCQLKMNTKQSKEFQQEHPKDQLITKTDFAKYQNTWAKKPHEVSKGAQANFQNFAGRIKTTWETDERSYNEVYYKKAVAIAILFKYTEKLVSNQPWFEKGYRANIVTYSIALLHELIDNQYPGRELNLMEIWEQQDVPAALSKVLSEIAYYVFREITDPSRETINVTQWCKRENCWLAVKDSCRIKLSAEIEEHLINPKDERKQNHDAKVNQGLRNDIDMQMFILEKGPEYWQSLNKFIMQKKIRPTGMQYAALTYAQRSASLLTKKQSSALIDLLNACMNEGFTG